MPKQFIIAGIGTEIGKTLISGILTHALKADYWKPIQAGNLTDGDAYWVKKWVSETHIWPSSYALTHPLSPHTAAELDGLRISLDAFQIPKTTHNLIIELAGGIMVPLNETETNLDLIKQLGLPVILVSKNYLGSINHTLLTFAQLKQADIPMAGIIFNGPSNPSGEAFIEQFTQLPVILRVAEEQAIHTAIIQKYAAHVKL